MSKITGKFNIKTLPACLILLSLAINMLFIPSFLFVSKRPEVPHAKPLLLAFEAGLFYCREDKGTDRLLKQDKLKSLSNIPGFSFVGVPSNEDRALPYLSYCFVSTSLTSQSFSLTKIVASLHLKDGMK